jgi:hypothetical protein
VARDDKRYRYVIYVRISGMSLPDTRPSSNPRLTWDTLFEVLSSARRRRLLAALARTQEMRVSGAIDHVAALESGVTTDRLDTSQTTPVRTSMYHVHLPALVDAGLVSWDRDADTVSLVGAASDLPPFTSVDGALVDQHGRVAPEVVSDGQ